MSGTPLRPGSADTMLLVLKPRQENYKNVAAQLSGSDNERLAYRKNRVIQMKLGTYLAEVCLQEKSSALILKNEEHRFLQKMSKRTTTPRSVLMLQELHRFMHKKFPKSAVDVERLRALGGRTVHPIPESFRDPEPSSAVAVVSPSKPNTLFEILEKLPSAVGQRERHVVVANMSCVSNNNNKSDNSGLKLELPSITSHSKTNNSNESSQEFNTVKSTPNPEETYIDRHETSYPPLPNITEDTNKLTEVADISYLTFNEQENDNVKDVFGIPFSDKSENITASQGQFHPGKVEMVRRDKLQDEETRCDDVISQSDTADDINELKEPSGKKGHRRASKTSTLNHGKTDRAPPLRHNITSVLRQEKTKMESHQVKIDDFPHKMYNEGNKGHKKYTDVRVKKQN